MCETTFGFFFFTTFFLGVRAFVLTGAVSLAVTLGPAGGGAVAVATVSKAAWTLVFVQLYVTDAPGAIEASAGMSALVRLQFGVSGSTTFTSVSTVLPAFVTVIVKVA